MDKFERIMYIIEAVYRQFPSIADKISGNDFEDCAEKIIALHEHDNDATFMIELPMNVAAIFGGVA